MKRLLFLFILVISPIVLFPATYVTAADIARNEKKLNDELYGKNEKPIVPELIPLSVPAEIKNLKTFKNTSWGMSSQQLKDVSTDNYKKTFYGGMDYNPNLHTVTYSYVDKLKQIFSHYFYNMVLEYSGYLNNLSCKIQYVFINDKLVRALYFFPDGVDENSKKIIEEALNAKYKTAEGIDKWENENTKVMTGINFMTSDFYIVYTSKYYLNKIEEILKNKNSIETKNIKNDL